ncbi:acyl-CoA synthetase [Aquabacterium humicola]|uniref:acyl-CoA synthetase n=1 Tax=Aquabacterium humicola TaxID=3237377 RepID=UPI002542CC5D|nr:acyl-CoA synthetase [Rubrivivax pictus]
MPAFHPPFAPQFPIRSLDDVRRLERTPLAEALPVRSTYELLCNSAHAFGDRTALTFLPDMSADTPPLCWSYRELLRGVHQTANLLHRLGVQPGDAVAVLLPACLDYHLALWGGEAAAIVQPLNPLLSDDKLASLITAARATVLFAWGAEGDAGYWAKALRLRGQVPTLRTLLRVAPPGQPLPPADLPTALPDGVLDFGAARAREPDDHLVSGRDIAPGDIAAYFHTGGTTGAPKLARHSHGAQVFTAWACVQMQGARADDVTINGYPLFHVAGVLPGSLAALSCGMQTVIPTPQLYRNREVLQQYWRLVERHRATVLSAVPTVLAALADVPIDGADISTLRYCRTGAAPLSPELSARFERFTGLHPHESLGMTEMAGISTITPPGVTAPAGCVGWRMPYAQLRIAALDAQGGATERELPAGETGMVLFKAPNLFSGFIDEADNAKAFTADGWLATGDLGWLDGEGRLHLTGRSKDLIIRSGHNIDPKVIEDALGSHPAVALCAAVGAPDAYAGELPVVFATLVPGAAPVDEAELLAHTAARVDEAPARPKRVLVIERMPQTNVGKIYKPELRALAAAAVVRELADGLARTHAADGAAVQVAAIGDQRVDVTLGAGVNAALETALRDALGRLPFPSRLVRA